MKRALYYYLLFLLIPVTGNLNAQETESEFIEWFGEDESANDMIWKGMSHIMNIEREKAYTFFEAAAEKDPTLFGPHVVLAGFSWGDKRDRHIEQAKKLVGDKNETSQLFVSLLDTERGQAGAQARRDIWAKMYKLGYDGRYINFNYARTRKTPQEQITALEDLASKYVADGNNNGHVHNLLGYLYYAEGDKEKAKMHFEKYLEAWPNGYNSYDSMAEFYMNEGDNEKALEYYKKARQHYVFATSATDKIKELEAIMSSEGDLILVTTENVKPKHMQEYWQWGMEYKGVAEKTGFQTFWVSSSNGSFNYAANVGKTLSDVEAYEKKWEEWTSSNEEIKAQYEKYQHTIESTKRSLWRHDPEMSYTPEGYSTDGSGTYVRTYRGFVKFGHEEALKKLMKEWKQTWTEHQISASYNVYWNVYGEEGPCVSFRTTYKDVDAWSAERKQVSEKIGDAKMMEMIGAWNEHIRTWDEQESSRHPELTHIQNGGVASN